MCNQWCLDFVLRCSQFWPGNERILEVGSRDVNGSPRNCLANKPHSYLGVDIENGPGVDWIVRAEDLTNEFGYERFDVVISTEMLEHVEGWRESVHQMASVLKPGGWMCLTTRSPGFEYHPYPKDCWRFTVEHMRSIFVPPMALMTIETDPDLRKGKYSGVGVLAKRGEGNLNGWWELIRTIQVATP